MNFAGYDFKNYIQQALNDLKFDNFTPVQLGVFKALKENKNLLVKSKTGSGKTHAFLIPIFQMLDEDSQQVFATIITPTKELALQTYKMAQHIASFCPKRINIKLYVGGTDRDKEIAKLTNSMPQIVIGTPGKVKDLAIDANALKIYTSKFFIIDEMDFLLNDGYEAEVDAIASVLKDSRMMFFSATLAEKYYHFTKKYLDNPNIVDIKDDTKGQIQHIWIPIKHRLRSEVLLDLLTNFQPYMAIVFVNKKQTVAEVIKVLSEAGYQVAPMHGDLSARERKRVLQECRNLKYQFLVATDLAARGLDISGLSHIINYEIPSDYEFYLHRSGRTGRMNQTGIVYSLYDDVDNEYLDNLAKKGIVPKYYEIKDGQLVPFKGRDTRKLRQKPTDEYQKLAAKYIPLPKKVKPNYRKKRQQQIDDLAKRLKNRHK